MVLKKIALGLALTTLSTNACEIADGFQPASRIPSPSKGFGNVDDLFSSVGIDREEMGISPTEDAKTQIIKAFKSILDVNGDLVELTNRQDTVIKNLHVELRIEKALAAQLAEDLHIKEAKEMSFLELEEYAFNQTPTTFLTSERNYPTPHSAFMNTPNSSSSACASFDDQQGNLYQFLTIRIERLEEENNLLKTQNESLKSFVEQSF